MYVLILGQVLYALYLQRGTPKTTTFQKRTKQDTGIISQFSGQLFTHLFIELISTKMYRSINLRTTRTEMMRDETELHLKAELECTPACDVTSSLPLCSTRLHRIATQLRISNRYNF